MELHAPSYLPPVPKWVPCMPLSHGGEVALIGRAAARAPGCGLQEGLALLLADHTCAPAVSSSSLPRHAPGICSSLLGLSDVPFQPFWIRWFNQNYLKTKENKKTAMLCFCLFFPSLLQCIWFFVVQGFSPKEDCFWSKGSCRNGFFFSFISGDVEVENRALSLTFFVIAMPETVTSGLGFLCFLVLEWLCFRLLAQDNILFLVVVKNANYFSLGEGCSKRKRGFW